MTRRFQALFLLCLLGLSPGLTGQEITIDPETGEPKMSKDDPTVGIEQIFKDGAYDTGAKTFAIKFEKDDPDWTCPQLIEKEAVNLNKAAIAVAKGDQSKVAVLAQAREKATPHFWNLLAGKLHAQKSIASALAQLPSNNGEALAFRMLLNEHKEVRDPAWKRFDTFSTYAKIGVWVHSNNKDVKEAAVKDLAVKKAKKAYQKVRDDLKSRNKKKVYSTGLSKNNPAWLAQLFIDHTLTIDELYWDAKMAKVVDKALKGSKADATWKTLAGIRFGGEVKKPEKISRHKDWYIRGAFCRAIRHRRDLAWDEDVIECLLERIRDVNLQVRLEANRALMALHPIPITFGRDRFLKEDSQVIAKWQRWWEKQQSLAKQFKGMEKMKATTLKLIDKNQKVFFGASTKNFPVYKCTDKSIGSFYMIDVDADGKFSLQIDRYLAGKKRNVEKHASTPFSRVLSNGNKLFLVDIDPATHEVRFKPFKGKTQKVKFVSKYGASHKAVGITATSAPDMHFPVNEKGETSLPLADGGDPVEYRLTAGWVIKKGSEAARILEAKATVPFKVSKETEEQVFGCDLDLALTWELDTDKNMIILNPVEIIGQAGEIYRKISPQLDNIKVKVTVEEKSKSLRDWEKKYLKIETAMLGGLVPPLKEPQVPVFRGLYDNYQQALRDLLTLQLELTTLQTQLTVKEAELAAAQAATPPDQPTIDALQAEVDDLNTQITAKETEITTKETERDTLYSQLLSGAGQVGMDYNSFIEAIFREEGVKFLARSMSDIYWLPYEIDLNKIKIAKDATKIIITLQSKVAFGDMKERQIEIQLKPNS